MKAESKSPVFAEAAALLRASSEVCPVTATSLELTMALAVATPMEIPRLRTIDRNEEPTPNRSGGIELISELLFGV